MSDSKVKITSDKLGMDIFCRPCSVHSPISGKYVNIIVAEHFALLNQIVEPANYINLYRAMTAHIHDVHYSPDTELGKEIHKYLAEQKGGDDDN